MDVHDVFDVYKEGSRVQSYSNKASDIPAQSH